MFNKNGRMFTYSWILFFTQEEFAFYEVNDPFVQNFITSLDSMLTSFKVCEYIDPSLIVIKTDINRSPSVSFPLYTVTFKLQ